MAVYNVEDYLEEAIDSLLNQSLSFKNHVQLILVNDGSKDGSGDICKKYQEQYRDNIIYIDKENGGVSSARNAGLEVATGRYVNFMDPDDKLSKNTLQVVKKFLAGVNESVDVVSIPIQWFDQAKGNHLLNYKFNKNKIINILKDHRAIQMSASSSFVKREAIGDNRFKKELKYGEDAEWLNRILLKKCEYGVVTKCKYLYRKRKVNTSATQQALTDKDYYLHSLNHFSFQLINMSKEILGFVPKYMQYMIMYDLQWRLNNNNLDDALLTVDERVTFMGQLKELLTNIDDDIILEQKSLNQFRKRYLLEIKHAIKPSDITPYYSNNSAVILDRTEMVDSLDDHKFAIELVSIEQGYLYLEGHFRSLFDNDSVDLQVKVGNEEITATKERRKDIDINVFGETIYETMGYVFKIKLNSTLDKENLSFSATVNNTKTPIGVIISAKSYLSNKPNSYYAKNGFILSNEKGQLTLQTSSFSRLMSKEWSVLKGMLKSKKNVERKAAVLRFFYYCMKMFKTKEIWLFMDRVNKADDNAEVLFRYAQNQNDNIKNYFIINESSEDYKRMQNVGKVLKYGSLKHKMYMLLADKFISSHADVFVLNPFGKAKQYYKDLMDYDYVFLQHGITKDDISGWLNKYKKNIRLFITAANQEYASIVNGNYNYSEREVILSGFPRFDKLVNKDEKRILIMPTWRSDLVHPINPLTGDRDYNPAFKDTKYFNEFNDLLNNENLLAAAKQNGYKIVFFPHPNIRQQLKDFQIPDVIEVANIDSSYNENFNKSSILITDYSSVAFDFAYLKKPVVYFQFEANHLAEGYFDYRTMGFGDVLEQSKQVADKIVEYINGNCVMEDEYVNRVESFYQYTDRDNCQRVYNAIKKINQTDNN